MKRQLANRSVHPVGLGCMNLSWAYGTPPSQEDGIKLLNRALDLGYDHLDTARIYGAGKNEALIAEALKGRRKEFFLASKCGIVVEGPKRGVDCSPRRSKARSRPASSCSIPIISTSITCTVSIPRCRLRIPWAR